MNGNQERSFFDPQELDYQESDVRQYLRNIPKRRLEEIKKKDTLKPVDKKKNGDK